MLRGFDAPITHVGLDFEFYPETYKPTALGISTEGVASSLWWDRSCDDACERMTQSDLPLVGHNALGAEDEVMRRLGHEIPLSRWEDTMILLYLLHPEFTSETKDAGDEESQTRGIGFLDLWSLASLYTDVPQWKRCRGPLCSGPCPRHDELGYNGVDAYVVDVAWPVMQAELAEKNIPQALYHRLKQLTLITNEMKRTGVYVDLEMVKDLQDAWEIKKASIFQKGERPRACGVCGRMKTGGPCKRCKAGDPPMEEYWSCGYNPNSPQAAVKYFKDTHKISLEKWDKDCVERAREEMTGAAKEDLDLAYEWKAGGKGFEPWFNPNYLGKDGFFHPRTNPCGSSLGRFSSSNPNFQNIPKVGFGAGIRGAVKARDESQVILRADYSQGEFRGVLWYAFVHVLGRDMPTLAGRDLFAELASTGAADLKRYTELTSRSARDGAKTVVHAADYFEGIRLLKPIELSFSSTQRAEEKGILLINRDWEFRGQVVAFTGVNLARRMFGSATHENRRRALNLQRLYLDMIPEVRVFHEWVIEQAEKGYLSTVSGRYIPLIEASGAEQLKKAAAAYAQGLLADYIQEAMVRYWERHNAAPLLNIHDELLWEVDRTRPLEEHYQWAQIMAEPSEIFEGFSCPIECKIGENWKSGKVFEGGMKGDYDEWMRRSGE